MPMDYDPETGEFPIRPELDDEIDENVLASMASSISPTTAYCSSNTLS